MYKKQVKHCFIHEGCNRRNNRESDQKVSHLMDLIQNTLYKLDDKKVLRSTVNYVYLKVKRKNYTFTYLSISGGHLHENEMAIGNF